MWLLIALLLFSGCVVCRGSSVEQIWQQWKLEHHKTYANIAEEEARKEIWKQSYHRVTQHNLAQHKFHLSLNQFSDMVMARKCWQSVLTATMVIFLCTDR